MRYNTLQRGQSLIEIIFAISIFVIGVVTIGYLTIDAFGALGNVTDRTEARLLAAEGIEALVSIRDSGFEKVAPGTHGLALSEGYWTLSSTPDTIGKFTRTITIEDIDTDIVEVTAEVSWEVFGGRERTVTYTTLISNWTQTKGDAGDLAVSTDTAALISFDTELIGIFLQNIGADDITITDVTIAWDTPASLTQIAIDGVDIWSASTSAAVASGAVVDVADYTIVAGGGFSHVSPIRFDASVAGSDIILIFTLTDGSTRSVHISP